MNDIPHEPSYTVDEFCKAERISRVRLYEMWKLGHGPRYYLNGVRRIITHRARLDWHREREAEVKPFITIGAAAQQVVEKLRK